MTQTSTLENPSLVLTGKQFLLFYRFLLNITHFISLFATEIVLQWQRKTTSSTLHFLPYLVGLMGKIVATKDLTRFPSLGLLLECIVFVIKDILLMKLL